MLIHLIKKDFLIIKRYVLYMLAFSVLVPFFVLWRVPQVSGALGFYFSVIFSFFMLLQFISQKEFQYPKASTLLCTTPYPRSLLVIAKYGFLLIIYGMCCLIFMIETIIFPPVGKFNLGMVVLMFFFISVFIGIYFPLQYKFGYEKMRFASTIVIISSPYLMPKLMILGFGDSFNWLGSISPMVFYSGMVLFSFVILWISAYASIQIYNQGDLE